MENAGCVPIGNLLIGAKELISSIKDSFDIIGSIKDAPHWARSLWSEILALHVLWEHAVDLGLNLDCLSGPNAEMAITATRMADHLMQDLTTWVDRMQAGSIDGDSLSAVNEAQCVQHQHRLEECRRDMVQIFNLLQNESARLAFLSMQDQEAFRTYQIVNNQMAGQAELAFVDEKPSFFGFADNAPSRKYPFAGSTSTAPMFDAALRRVRPAMCSKFCRCRCHSVSATQFPIRTRNLLNRLFLRISGSPKLIHSCNIPDCRKNLSGSPCVVVVHARFLRRLVTLSASSQGAKIQVNVKVHPVLPFSADIIRFSEAGDYPRFKNLIQSGRASPFTAGSDGWTLLHNAAFHGHFEMAKFLLSLHVDTEATEVKGRKASHFAKFRALMKGATEEEKLLADLFEDSAEFMYDFELTPIHSAVLHEYNVTDSERPNLKTLLKFAEDISQVRNHKGDWVSWRWQYRERSPLFRQLIDWFEKGGAVGETGTDRLNRLIEQADGVQNWTPLQWAAFVDHKSEFAQLLDSGADLFKITSSGRNMLHQAAESGTSDVLEYILSEGYHQSGLEIDLHDIWGETPLHIAAAKGNSAVHLLKHGANVDAVQSENQVPLAHTRYQSGEQRLQSVKLLSATPGHHFNCQDASGAPPLHHLVDDIPCVKELVDKGSSLFITDHEGKNIIHVACTYDHLDTLSFLLSEYPAESRELVEEVDNQGGTPLIAAFRNNSIRCARLLLQKVSPSVLIDGKRWSLLHHAINAGDPVCLRHVISIPGIDFRARTSDGETAADIAKRRGYRNDLVYDILQRKGDPRLVDLYGKAQSGQTSWELYAAYR